MERTCWTVNVFLRIFWYFRNGGVSVVGIRLSFGGIIGVRGNSFGYENCRIRGRFIENCFFYLWLLYQCLGRKLIKVVVFGIWVSLELWWDGGGVGVRGEVGCLGGQLYSFFVVFFYFRFSRSLVGVVVLCKRERFGFWSGEFC